MSVEQALQDGPKEDQTQPESLDAALDSVWAKHGGGEFDDSPVYEDAPDPAGPERGPDGKFVSREKGEEDAQESTEAEETEETPEGEAEPEKAADDADKPEDGEETEEGETEDEKSAEGQNNVPTAWQHRKELWEKIDSEAREFISQREDELHRRMSDLGRQVSDVKPVREVLDHYRQLYQGQMSDEQAVGTLFNAQAALENPQTRLQALMQIADNYGAVDQLKAVLNGEQEMPRQQSQQQPQMQSQGLTPEQVRQMLQQELASDRANREVEQKLSRLTQDKPLYSEIPEQDMVHYINKAWDRLGNTASQEAVFDAAYDMAVHADPDLRSKSAALKPKAAERKGVSTEAAKRANSVNVTSTSSGKAQKPSMDAALDAVWEKHANGRT